MIKHSLFTIFLSLTLISCVTATVKDVQGPDGELHHLVECSYVEYCYEKATEICGKYKIVNTTNKVSSQQAETGANTETDTQMLIKCGR